MKIFHFIKLKSFSLVIILVIVNLLIKFPIKMHKNNGIFHFHFILFIFFKTLIIFKNFILEINISKKNK